MRSWSHHATALPARQPYGGGFAVTPLRPGFDLVLSNLNTQDSEPFFHTEDDDVFGMGFHLKGGASFKFDDVGFVTCPGDCWIVGSPRGATSTFRIGQAGFRTLSLRLSPETAGMLLGEDAPLASLALRGRNGLMLRAGRPVHRAQGEAIEALFSTSLCGSVRHLLLESAALSLVASQMGMQAEPAQLTSPRPGRIERARERLDASLDDPPTLATLAREVGTNDFQLKRDFKLTYGMTVFGYVRELRMRRAADQLRQGASVQEVAFKVGYDCPSRFAQAFRRRYGITPSAFGQTRMI